MINFIVEYIRNRKKLLLLHIITYIGFSVMDIFVPLVQSNYIDNLVNIPSKETIFRFVILIAVLGLLTILIHYVNNLCLVRLQSSMSIDIKVDIIEHLQRSPLQSVKKFNSAYLTQRIEEDVTSVVVFFLGNYTAFFECGISIVIVSILLYTINNKILIIIILIIPLYALTYIGLRKKLLEKNKVYIEDKSKFYNELNNQIDYLENIKVSAYFNENIANLKGSFTEMFSSLLGLSKLSFSYRSLDQFVTVIFQVFIYLAGGLLIVKGDISIGQFVILTSYYTIILRSIKYYLSLGESYEAANASYSRIEELLNVDLENNGLLVLKGIEYIDFTDVEFSYNQIENEKTILEKFSQNFIRNNVYVIKGENGKGKTTIINLLLGLYQNLKSGKISYNGTNISDIDMYKLRHDKIAVLPQKIKLKNQKVGEIFCCEVAEIEAFIYSNNIQNIYENDEFSLKKILDKNINDLSGGERQKLMLLDTLLRDSDLCILDEPTSAIDICTVVAIQDMLTRCKENKIFIVITHDPSFDRIADEIINL